jgi:hypothetical protein
VSGWAVFVLAVMAMPVLLVAGVMWADAQHNRRIRTNRSRSAYGIRERNTCWTAFGPTNVAMYAVSVEVESGEAVGGLRLAEKIDHDQSPSIERRVAFLLDQAKGYGQRRDYASALLLLNTR